MKTDMTTDMKQLIDSMEKSIKLRNRARAAKRADEAEQKKKEFEEKLMRASAGKIELDGMSAKVKGAEDAVRRDQLMGLMGSL